MSKEKDLTTWGGSHSNSTKRSKTIISQDNTFNNELGIDEHDFEQYDAIRALEESEITPEPTSFEYEEQTENILPEDNLAIPQNRESLDSTGEFAPEVNIHDILERIIFDKRELTALKTTISAFTQGSITPKELKKTVLASYIRIFEDIAKFISFFLTQESKKLGDAYSSSQKEQEEKDTLLDHLALRINNIYKKLKAYPDSFFNDTITSGHRELAKVPSESIIEIKGVIPTEVIEPSSAYENCMDQIIYIDDEPYNAEECYFVIDGANVALDIKDSENRPMISTLYQLVERLHSLGITQFKVLSDRNLHHKIDNQDAYKALKERDEFDETPGGTEADYFILQYAKRKDAFIISNDMFRKHYSRFGEEWIKKKRIAFSFIDGALFFDRM